MRTGLHVLRNTAYLFGILCDRNRDDLHKTSHYKSAESYNRHEQDNATLFELLKRCSSRKFTLLLIPKWVSDHVDYRDSTSLIHVLVPNNSNDEFKSLKY